MPIVKISVGELCDKITILEIKQDKFPENENVKKELDHLDYVYAMYLGPMDCEPLVADAMCRLRGINESLWHVEDHLREFERDKVWGRDFISYARDVYRLNDERAKIKREINELTGSEIVEEKFYAKY